MQALRAFGRRDVPVPLRLSIGQERECCLDDGSFRRLEDGDLPERLLDATCDLVGDRLLVDVPTGPSKQSCNQSRFVRRDRELPVLGVVTPNPGQNQADRHEDRNRSQPVDLSTNKKSGQTRVF